MKGQQMKYLAGIVLTLATISGCTEVSDYYSESQLIELDGRSYFVAPHPRAAGVYLAGPNKPTGGEVFLGDGLALPAANVRAIEMATGCAVEPATIKNTNAGTTWAAVSC